MQQYPEVYAQFIKNRRLTLAVVIPCYNEVETIAEVLQRVEDVGLAHEIIIVDDGLDGWHAGGAGEHRGRATPECAYHLS